MGNRVRANANASHERRDSGLHTGWWIAAIVVIVIAAAAWWLWQAPQWRTRIVETVQQSLGLATQEPAQPGPVTTAENAAAPAAQATVDAALPQAPENPAPLHPLEPLEAQAPAAESTAAALPPLEASDGDLQATLTRLAGDTRVATLVRGDQLVRRIVATVDNLPSQRAPTQMWPVHPTAPRFTVDDSGGEADTFIAPANSARYAPAVALFTRLDMQQLAREYRRYYPLFQQAYEELGYPDRYFNDRLVAVIDHLLQAPEPVAPRVRLMPVRGEIVSQQPWVRYEFEDPQLEALSAGQKILVRMGPENARRVKSQLRALRAAITAAAPANQSAAP
ncbi:DUF3014 domain-containing protein [Lampropedia cohaerens]|uniref:DUF3014 domain-containing protein n=1 Tax=Lampropedia cohaerens TaxID=1610491 RepID=UPI000699B185|nr:DUF3014 domain-containing protein [Lampropedia cohaerens]